VVHAVRVIFNSTAIAEVFSGDPGTVANVVQKKDL